MSACHGQQQAIDVGGPGDEWLAKVADSIERLRIEGGEHLAERLLEEFARNMSAEGGAFFIREPEGLRRRFSLDPPNDPELLHFPLPEQSAFAKLLREKHPLLVEDAGAEFKLLESGWQSCHGSSLLLFPLLDEQGDVQALISLHRGSQQPFNERDLEMGAIIAIFSSRLITIQRQKSCRIMLAGAAGAIVLADINRCPLLVSPEWEQLIGLTGARARSSVDSFLAPVDRPAFTDRCRLAATWKEPVPDLHSRIVGCPGAGKAVLVRFKWLRGMGKLILSFASSSVPESPPQALEREHDSSRALIADSPVFFMALDEHYRILEMNPAMQSAFGYAGVEVNGKDSLQLLCHPEERNRMEEAFLRMKRGAGPIQLETRFLARNGEQLIVEWRARAVRGHSGKTELLFGLGRDITLQCRAREALEYSERTFRSIVDNAHAAMLILDDQGRLVYVNPQFCRMFERPARELIGRSIEESLEQIFDSEAIAVLRGRSLVHPAGELVPSLHTVSTRRRGAKTRWFEVRTAMIQSAQGDQRIVAQLLDISGEVKAKRELEEREARYRTLVESAPVGILSVDRHGCIQELNQKMLEILGLPSMQATRAINVLTYPLLVRAGIAENLKLCFQTGEPRILESLYKSQQGRKAFLRYHLTPLNRERNRIMTVQAIVEDISEQKRLEQRILDSQKMEALGILGGGIAHEFNNLLQVIQGYAEILAYDARLPPKRFQAVLEIQEASRRAVELTRKLIAFSGKIESELNPLDLNREVRQTLDLLQNDILQNIAVELELGELPRPVLADANQLQQMLTNLALNSREALARHIHVRTQAAAVGEGLRETGETLPLNPYVLLAFQDDGTKIDPAVTKNIFKQGQGGGLGLSMVYGIVHKHGGHIEYASSREEGTTFNIYLPTAGDLQPQRSAEMNREPMPSLASEKNKTILLADNELILRKLGVEFLNNFGYTVLSAGDCREAMSVFRERQGEIDLVILDLAMPELGGEWCIEEMLHLKPEQKVLVASSHSLDTTVGELLCLGACAFITKPYRLLELLAAVREVLGITACG